MTEKVLNPSLQKSSGRGHSTGNLSTELMWWRYWWLSVLSTVACRWKFGSTVICVSLTFNHNLNVLVVVNFCSRMFLHNLLCGSPAAMCCVTELLVRYRICISFQGVFRNFGLCWRDNKNCGLCLSADPWNSSETLAALVIAEEISPRDSWLVK